MVVDGKVGPVTSAWITKFQHDSTKTGFGLVADGVVTNAPANDHHRKRASLASRCTIRRLNDIMSTADAEVYQALSTHPDVPSDVRRIFSQVQDDAVENGFD